METNKDFKTYYVYSHITLTGEVTFYIGIGTKHHGDCRSIKKRYARAYDNKRSNFWKKVSSKYGYRVEILEESNDHEYIQKQEIFYIQKYGRKDLGLGTLVNLTNGGESNLDQFFSKETRAKMSASHKKLCAEGKKAFSKPGFYEETSKRMKGNSYAKGNKLSEEQRRNLVERRLDNLSKNVIQEDLEGNFIKEWRSTVDAGKFYSTDRQNIWKACNNYYKGATSKGFRWRFKE